MASLRTGSSGEPIETRAVYILTDAFELRGDLAVPEPGPRALVVFVDPSGPGRTRPANVSLARALEARRFATLRLDLLTAEEAAVDETTREHRFDIDLLAHRVALAAQWVRSTDAIAHLPIGLFGVSTGAAAALRAAARMPGTIGAIVSSAGRPDLAEDDLERVTAPTLMCVGERDLEVRALTAKALRSMEGDRQLYVVPGAGHVLDEPETLEVVAARASEWFGRHLGQADQLSAP